MSTRRPGRLPDAVGNLAAAFDDEAAIRERLEAYRILAAQLPELLRAARRLDEPVPIAELARLAGVDRGRVHRAIRGGNDRDPEATHETADMLRENVMTGAYRKAEQVAAELVGVPVDVRPREAQALDHLGDGQARPPHSQRARLEEHLEPEDGPGLVVVDV